MADDDSSHSTADEDDGFSPLARSDQDDLKGGVGRPSSKKKLSLYDGCLVEDEVKGSLRAGLFGSISESFRSLSVVSDVTESSLDAEAKFLEVEGRGTKASSVASSSSPLSGEECSLGDPRCVRSEYGNPASSERAEELIGPAVDGGFVWRAHLLPDDYDGAIKPRRGRAFPVKATEFFSSLAKVEGEVDPNASLSERTATDAGHEADEEDPDDDPGYSILGRMQKHSLASVLFGSKDKVRASIGSAAGSEGAAAAVAASSSRRPRWVFTGVLNGWPALRTLELVRIDSRPTSSLGKMGGWTRHWSDRKEGACGVAPSFPADKPHPQYEVRATLRAPPWTARGWSEESPGFLFWFRQTDPEPSVVYGTDILREFKVPEEEDPLCTRVHMIAHRYATGQKAETPKDKVSYHSAALLEWDHGKHCTIFEIGWLGGIGGYRGKTNWSHDKDEKETTLYRCLKPEMVFPWKDSMSEIRATDIPVKDLEGFKQYIAQYEGHDKRFVDPHYPFSHDVRLTYRSRRNIAAYMLNYIRRDRTYSEMRRNCQTFVADVMGFLAGKRDVQPFHPINQVQYRNQRHMFLYDSHMYGE